MDVLEWNLRMLSLSRMLRALEFVNCQSIEGVTLKCTTVSDEESH
jgi:hypothetical protein